ncbi:MAG: hypothetical protein ACYTG4_00530 [Planctomycetota bacterium]|jgi:hypothetical protein
MTRRAARLVAAAALLALGAAALATFADRFQPGLEDALASNLVVKEVLAGLAILVAVLVPAFLADESERPAESHAGLLCLFAAAPAVVALAGAGGIGVPDLLPAAGVIVACDLLASSYMRADHEGKRATTYSAAAVGLLAGLPILCWALADLGGIDAADNWAMLSPVLAVREAVQADGTGWAKAGPCILLLVALSMGLRLLVLLRPRQASLEVVAT